MHMDSNKENFLLIWRKLFGFQFPLPIDRIRRIILTVVSMFMSNTSMTTVATSTAPAAIGPYSQAVIANGFVFVSGQIPLDPATMQFAGDDVATQTKQVFANLRAILTEAGSSLQQVVRCDVFVGDISDFGTVNDIYAEEFAGHAPARQTVQAVLPKGAKIEISCIAIIS